MPVPDINKMAVLQTGSSTNYRGVLYDWYHDALGNTPYTWSADSTDFREPANLGTSYDNATNINGWTESLYQTCFNNMVSSVATYGGFYISRYEVSKDNNGNAQSKPGVVSASAAATTDPSGVSRWYGLYNLTKTYNMASVTSDMVWGCQIDAMCRWIRANGTDITSNNPVDISIGTVIANADSNRVTGSQGKDKMNNIYDLLGCRREWTQECKETAYRVFRGGISSAAGNLKGRSYDSVGINSANRGTRMTLYINQ